MLSSRFGKPGQHVAYAVFLFDPKFPEKFHHEGDVPCCRTSKKTITEPVMDNAAQAVTSQCELRTDEWNGCVTTLPLLCAIMQRHERSMIWMSAKEQNWPKTNASSQ